MSILYVHALSPIYKNGNMKNISIKKLPTHIEHMNMMANIIIWRLSQKQITKNKYKKIFAHFETLHGFIIKIIKYDHQNMSPRLI